jgi:hypothetical protein
MWAEGCDAVFDRGENAGSARRSHTMGAAKGAAAAAAARGDGVGFCRTLLATSRHPTHSEPSFLMLNCIL